jgi:hypothetical protein
MAPNHMMCIPRSILLDQDIKGSAYNTSANTITCTGAYQPDPPQLNKAAITGGFRRKCPIDGGKGRGSRESEECRINRQNGVRWEVRRPGATMRGHSRSAGPGARPGIGRADPRLGLCALPGACSGHARVALRLPTSWCPVSFAYLGIKLIGRLDANLCSRRCARKVHHLFGRARRFRERVEKRFCRFEIGRVETLGKLVVHGLEERHRIGGSALIA